MLRMFRQATSSGPDGRVCRTPARPGGRRSAIPIAVRRKSPQRLRSPQVTSTSRFYAAAGVPYHLWFRMRAEGDSYLNDSMFVQFSGAVNSQGTAVNRIGSSNAAIVILEEGNGAGVSGWGWNDDGYGTLASPVYFATSGLQTIRVQQREDGIMWDQLVLSSNTYLTTRPGLARVDTTVVGDPDGSGIVASHPYAVAGTYPVVLTVLDNGGAASAAATTVIVR